MATGRNPEGFEIVNYGKSYDIGINKGKRRWQLASGGVRQNAGNNKDVVLQGRRIILNGEIFMNGTTTTSTNVNINNIDGVVLTNPGQGDYLAFDGSNFINGSISLSNLDTTGANPNDVISYDGTEWTSSTPNVGVMSLNDLSDVTLTPISGKEVMVSDGTVFSNNLLAPSDLDTTGAGNGDIISYNGTEWEATTLPSGGTTLQTLYTDVSSVIRPVGTSGSIAVAAGGNGGWNGVGNYVGQSFTITTPSIITQYVFIVRVGSNDDIEGLSNVIQIGLSSSQTSFTGPFPEPFVETETFWKNNNIIPNTGNGIYVEPGVYYLLTRYLSDQGLDGMTPLPMGASAPGLRDGVPGTYAGGNSYVIIGGILTELPTADLAFAVNYVEYTPFPQTNSLPLVTGGQEILSQVYTPSSASVRARIDATIFCVDDIFNSANLITTFVLFVDSTAVAASNGKDFKSGTIILNAFVTPGSVTPVTVSVRASGHMLINSGIDGQEIFGTAGKSSLFIQEVM